MIRTDRRFPSVSIQMKGLLVNPDGSITMELKDANDRGWRKGV